MRFATVEAQPKPTILGVLVILAEAMKNLGYVQRFGIGIQLARQQLEKNGNRPSTVFDCIQPLLKGTGDIVDISPT